MGPVFGVKGGGTGGGHAQIAPMEDINLHFNGDFHAVTAAHSLLAAAIDASIFNGNPLRIDPATIMWPRTVDMNDRELRYTVVGLGGKTHGIPRENEFVITAASEVMAVFALASDLADLRRRLGRIVVASTYDGEFVTADMLKAGGAMTVIMKDALQPNLVQTLEGQPALVHAGPFGNIAHANNSILADRIALKLADYVITEAGFASDLGLQKFCDIVCRTGGFAPSAAVLVTSVRATKSHGGKAVQGSGRRRSRRAGEGRRQPRRAHPDRPAVRAAVRGRHQQLPHRHAGRDRARCANSRSRPAPRPSSRTTASGRAARAPWSWPRRSSRPAPSRTRSRASRPPTRPSSSRSRRSRRGSTARRASTCRCRPSRTCSASRSSGWARRRCAWPRRTCRSRTTRCCAIGRQDFILPVRGMLPSAGAGFVVVLCGDMQRMPGLGKTPAFQNIDIDANGQTVGLF